MVLLTKSSQLCKNFLSSSSTRELAKPQLTMNQSEQVSSRLKFQDNSQSFLFCPFIRAHIHEFLDNQLPSPVKTNMNSCPVPIHFSFLQHQHIPNTAWNNHHISTPNNKNVSAIEWLNFYHAHGEIQYVCST